MRVQDRIGAAGLPTWRINTRTGALKTRAGLSWTGVREYRTASGVLRVLRRFEQVNAPGHIATLRTLPTTDAHPPGDVDVDPTNEAELRVGTTGELIDIEDLDGYARPVGNVIVSRPSTMAKMVDAAAWAALCERYPKLCRVERRNAPPATGTSLGYNAIWHSPYMMSEIVAERDDGALVGEWQGPRGAELYDVEHIVDPNCEIVEKLVRETGFAREELGGNHFAVALEELGGRGGAQSELMRIVDGRDLALPFDARRDATRVSVQVPAPAEPPPEPAAEPVQDKAEWTVGTARDLPIASGDWDGDAAKASVFEWAGFDGDSPDAKAREAFLIYDASAPELKGSYKLPIARVRDGKLEAVDAGLRAAASRLPQTDAPPDVLERARGVLDHYFERLQDKPSGKKSRTKDAMELEIGISRDSHTRFAQSGLVYKLAAKGIHIPLTSAFSVQDEDGAMSKKLDELRGFVESLMEMAGKSMEEAEDMSEKMGDMKSPEDIEKMIAEYQGKIDELKEQLKEAGSDMKKMQDQRDALLSEVRPLRAKELTELRAAAVDFGCDEATVKACTDAKQVRRAIAVHKSPESDYGKQKTVRDAKGEETSVYVVSDNVIEGYVDGALAARGEKTLAPAPARDTSEPFRNIPTPAPRKTGDRDDTPAPEAVNSLNEGLAALGG